MTLAKKLWTGIVAMFVVTISPAYAADSPYDVLDQVLARDNMEFRMRYTSGVVDNPQNCNADNGSPAFYGVRNTNNEDILISTIMTAYAMGHKVKFYFTGCTPNGYPAVYAAQVKIPTS